MSETIRSFIAIDLDSSLKTLIQNIQSELMKSQCDIKWVKPDNAHITLKFLGDVAKERIPTLKESLESILKEYHQTDLTVTELGAFPQLRFPKIIWLGLKEDGSLSQMVKDIEKKFQKLGFPKEKKKFTAHITIGRLKSTKNIKSIKTYIQNFSIQEHIHQSVDHISFYQSTLTPQGPIYDCFFQIPLIN